MSEDRRKADRERFMAALMRARREPNDLPDQATHERVAREAVAANPDLAQHALETGNYLPLIRRAREIGEGKCSEFWLAQRVGQLVRGDQP